MKKDKIVGYFMESGIFRDGKELPPQKTPLVLIGDRVTFNLDDYGDDDDISVLSEEGNWYTIKKKELILPELESDNEIILDEFPILYSKDVGNALANVRKRIRKFSGVE